MLWCWWWQQLWCVSFLHTHQLRASHRHPCASQWGAEHDGAENHPVWFCGFPPRPLHYSARGQGQVFLHLCLLQVALQQDSGCRLWCCMVIICLKKCLKNSQFSHQWDKNSEIEITYFNRPFRKCVKETIIEKFAGPYDRGEYSPSVQKTLYETQCLVLDRLPEVSPHFRS